MTTSIESLTGINREQGITGHFPSRLAIFESFVRKFPDNETYQAWAKEHSVDPKSGSIVTSVNNLDLLQRRFSTLSAQLKEFAGTQEKDPKAKAAVPDNLRAVLAAAAENATPDAGPLKMLLVTSLQRIPHFEIRETFPGLKIHITVAAPTADYEESCNREIRITRPDMSDELVYKSEWQGQEYDLVAFNPVIQYLSQDELREFIEDVAATGAKHVVASDLLPNRDKSGASHWQTQPYSGGVIPIRMLGKGELVKQMEKAGYKLVAQSDEPISYPVDERSGIARQYPSVPNYTFERI